MRKQNLRIGDVVWVKLHKEGKHIQTGVRPAVVIQNNKGNRYSPTIQVVPLTSKKTKAKLPTHVEIPANTAGLPKDSIAQCEGAKPVSKCDIYGFIGKMPREFMEKISIATIISTPLIQYIDRDNLNSIYDQVITA